MCIDFDNEIESQEEKAIRAQLNFYQQTKIGKNNSFRGKTETKTKYSENAKVSDNDSVSSDWDIAFESEYDARNSIGQYFHDPSLMKKRKPYLGIGTNRHPHPLIDKLGPSQFKGTDLTKFKMSEYN